MEDVSEALGTEPDFASLAVALEHTVVYKSD